MQQLSQGKQHLFIITTKNMTFKYNKPRQISYQQNYSIFFLYLKILTVIQLKKQKIVSSRFKYTNVNHDCIK